jgi:hypothetical protein
MHSPSPSRFVKWLPAAAALAFAAGLAAAEPGPAESGEPVKAAADRIEALLKALPEADRKRQDEIRSAIEQLLRVYPDALLVGAGDERLEVRMRATELLEAAGPAVRLHRIHCLLPDGLRAKLRTFQADHARLMHDLMTGDTERRVTAMLEIADTPATRENAEPLVILCLRHRSPKLVSAAAVAAQEHEYTSPAFTDALLSAMVRFRDWEQLSNHVYTPYGTQQATPHPFSACIEAIREHRPQAALPVLLAIYRETQAWNTDRCVEIVDAIVVLGRLEAILSLTPQLKHSRQARSSTRNGSHLGTAMSDVALYGLLQLTGQSRSAYGLVVEQTEYDVRLGFRREQDRKTAIAKWQKWWADHRKHEKYKDLKPVQVPNLARGYRPSRAKQAGRPATAPAGATTKPANHPALVGLLTEVHGLAADLHKHIADLLDQSGSPDYRKREDAARRLRMLAGSLLRALADVDHAISEQRRQAAAGLLSGLVARVQANAHVARCEPADRKALLAFRKERPGTVEAIFGLSQRRRISALKKLRSLGEPQQVEPLVLLGLTDEAEAVQLAALNAVQSGRFTSDALVDAVGKLVLEGATQRHWIHQPQGVTRQAIQALKATKSRRAVPILVAMMTQDNQQTQTLSLLAELVGQSGEKRAILNLMPALKAGSNGSWSTGKVEITVSRSDPALMACILLLGEKPAEYGFTYLPHHRDPRVYGFKTDKERKQAIEKFKEQWEAVKLLHPEYKKLKPLLLPSVEGDDQTTEGGAVRFPG